MPRGTKQDTAVVTSTGVLNTDTASSAATFPVGPLPSSVQRGVLPKISGVSIRTQVPELPDHIKTKIKNQQQSNTSTDILTNNEDAEERKDNNNGNSSDNEAAVGKASDAVVSISFDMDPVAAPIANLLRRVIITEVPTMAFDRVLIEENDTPVYDEMMCQRLGMVPIQVDAVNFEFVTSENAAGTGNTPNTVYSSSKHVLRFDLDVAVPLDAPLHSVQCVYASQLKWIPLPGQESFNVRIVHPELLLAKIGCGQRLKLQAFALKGIGLTHAKWSPVSACYYEMKTQVRLLKPVVGEQAHQLVKLAPKVFGLVANNSSASADDANSNNNNVEAVVLKEVTFQDCSRLYQDGVDFSDFVSIEKVKDSVRFTLEALGQYHNPVAIVGDALKMFSERLRYLKDRIDKTKPGNAAKFETAAQSVDV